MPLTHSLYDRDSLIIVLNAVSGTVAKPSSFIDVNTKYRNINPLSAGQSKIGRRRPISLDYHCVNISQRIFINKISLERSFHYLNADTLFLKIGQEMTPLQPFEVTQLIDFALDRSTSVTCGRDFAHSITMVTWNVQKCIQQMTARIQAVDWRKNELHSCSTDEERLDFLFQFSEGDFLHSGLCILGV